MHICIFAIAENWSHPIVFSPGRLISRSEGRGENNCCQYCGKSFTVRSTLEAHIAGVHFKTKRYRCSDCGMDFTYKTNVYRHKRICKGSTLLNKTVQHPVQRPQLLTCELCFIFLFFIFLKDKKMLRYLHSRKMSSVPQSVVIGVLIDINYCVFTCWQNYNELVQFLFCFPPFFLVEVGLLQDLFGFHHFFPVRFMEDNGSSFFPPGPPSDWKLRAKNFSCEFCGKRFRLRRECVGHVNFVHFKIKPFVCTLCNKGFSHMMVLKRHQKLCYARKITS